LKYPKLNTWIVIVSLVGALALTACDTGGPPATPSTPTSAPTPSAAPTSKPIPTIEPTRPVAIATKAPTREAVATSQSSGGWQTFISDEGGFSIDMPGKPTNSTQPSSAGTTTYLFSLTKGSDSYLASYTDVPVNLAELDPEQLLDNGRDGALNSTGGELVEESKITLGKYPGRDFTYKITALNGNIRQRAYVVDQRLYQIVTTGPGNAVNSADAEKFFDSFKLTGTGTTSQPTAAATSRAIPTSGSGDTGGNWQTFTSQGGNFSVELPGKPQEGSQSIPVGTDTMELHTFSLGMQKESYTMTYSDYPASIMQTSASKLLEGALTGVLGQGTLVDKKSITVDGNPGIQAEFEVPGTGYSWYKTVIVGERMYQLIVIAQDKDATAQDAQRFLDSFELVP
jgi:hypothetical protein